MKQEQVSNDEPGTLEACSEESSRWGVRHFGGLVGTWQGRCLTTSTTLAVRVNASCHEMSIVVIRGKLTLSLRICGRGNDAGSRLGFGLFSRSFW